MDGPLHCTDYRARNDEKSHSLALTRDSTKRQQLWCYSKRMFTFNLLSMSFNVYEIDVHDILSYFLFSAGTLYEKTLRPTPICV